jgi:cell division protein FtsB
MSSATAATTRTAPSTRPTTSLRVVPRPRPKAARGAFVLLIVALLVGGLMTLLALNTALAQDAFVVQNLQQQHDQLDDQEQQLKQQVAALESPVSLATRARALGMVPGGRPTFLRVGGPKPVAPTTAVAREQDRR